MVFENVIIIMVLIIKTNCTFVDKKLIGFFWLYLGQAKVCETVWRAFERAGREFRSSFLGVLRFAPGAFGGPPKIHFYDWLKRGRTRSRKS